MKSLILAALLMVSAAANAQHSNTSYDAVVQSFGGTTTRITVDMNGDGCPDYEGSTCVKRFSYMIATYKGKYDGGKEHTIKVAVDINAYTNELPYVGRGTIIHIVVDADRPYGVTVDPMFAYRSCIRDANSGNAVYGLLTGIN